MSLNIVKKQREDDLWKVSISGEMDINSYSEVKEELNSMVEKDAVDIEIDCANLSYIDSTGIGVLIGILKKLKKYDKKIFIINTKENIRRLFNITGLDKIFDIK